jgi:hypothetical protein
LIGHDPLGVRRACSVGYLSSLEDFSRHASGARIVVLFTDLFKYRVRLMKEPLPNAMRVVVVNADALKLSDPPVLFTLTSRSLLIALFPQCRGLGQIVPQLKGKFPRSTKQRTKEFLQEALMDRSGKGFKGAFHSWAKPKGEAGALTLHWGRAFDPESYQRAACFDPVNDRAPDVGIQTAPGE